MLEVTHSRKERREIQRRCIELRVAVSSIIKLTLVAPLIKPVVTGFICHEVVHDASRRPESMKIGESERLGDLTPAIFEAGTMVAAQSAGAPTIASITVR